MNAHDDASEGRDKKPHPITFTIDGKTFTTTDREQPARDLITLAGLDPAKYDLAEVQGDHEKSYDDDETVKINPNHAFVTVRQSATVG